MRKRGLAAQDQPLDVIRKELEKRFWESRKHWPSNKDRDTIGRMGGNS